MNKFYVYLHIRNDSGQVFYVGKGCDRRAWKTSGRSEIWKRTSSKHGHTVEILFDNLTESEAFDLEKNTILELKYFNHPLVNLTTGGEGTAGRSISDEHREILRKVNSSRKRTKEEIEKSRIARTGLKKTPEQIEAMRKSITGIKRSEEFKKQISERQFKNPPNMDNNIYLIFNDEHFFIGTRNQFCKEFNVNRMDIRTLFWSKPNKTSKGWSKENPLILLLINTKELYK